MKAQANAPTILDAQPVTQKVTPNIVKLPIKTEKKRDIKTLPNGLIQQSPRNIVLPPGSVLPPIVVPPNVRLPPKLPKTDETTTDLHQGPDPSMDIEENSPHQEGIITETYVAPDQSYLEQPQKLIKLVNTLKLVQRHLLQQADIDRILNIIKRKVLKGCTCQLPLRKYRQATWPVHFLRICTCI